MTLSQRGSQGGSRLAFGRNEGPGYVDRHKMVEHQGGDQSCEVGYRDQKEKED